MPGLPFLEYRLTSAALCLGERKKKGTYRSSLLTIPYSQITGALEARWGTGTDECPIHAVGALTDPNPRKPESVARHTAALIYSRRDSVRDVAALPIETRVLIHVQGQVFVARNEFTAGWPKDAFQIRMGAYRDKGLGVCLLTYTREREAGEIVSGKLLTRIPEDLLTQFGIQDVQVPRYGYLFRPNAAHEGGRYVRALIEGSLVSGPSFLVASGEDEKQEAKAR